MIPGEHFSQPDLVNPAGQNENPVRIEKNLVEKNPTKDPSKSTRSTRSLTVGLSDNIFLDIPLPKSSQLSETEAEKFQHQLDELNRNKERFYEITKPSVGSKAGILADPNQLRAGDLGKPSSPATKAHGKASANRAKAGNSKPANGVDAWLQNPSKRSRPAAANRLGQRFQPGQPPGGGDGLLGRFSPQTGPDPYNPGCAGGPRSITVLSGQQNQSEYQPDGYSKEQIQMYKKNPKYSELAKDPQLMGQECSINPKSEEEACTVLQAENEGLVSGAKRTDLKAGDPNYDYKTDAPSKYTEIKVPRDGSLKDAARLGRKSGLQQGNNGDVTLLVNLMRLRAEKRGPYAKVFLEAAGGDGVIFINN